MSRFTREEQQSIEYLAERAKTKDFLADLVLHGYNHVEYTVDIWRVLRYLEGEPMDSELEPISELEPMGSKLERAVYTQFALMRRGVESHDVVGDAVIDELIAQRRDWEKRQAEILA